jgi:hypothetical protein
MVMRELMLGVLAVVSIGGAAAAGTPGGSATAPAHPTWGCKADHEPARKTPAPDPSKAAARAGRLYLLEQPSYCDPPKPAPERDRSTKAPRPT